jgi:uncharacterized protein
MVLSTRQIPEEGMNVDFSIPLSVMRSGLRKDEEAFALFDADVACRLRLEMHDRDVFVSGEVDASLHPLCARCGEPFVKPVLVPLVLTCSPAKGLHGADSYQESDEGLVFYRDEKLDLTEIVREQMFLALPMIHLCGPGCRGLCPKCGGNLNKNECTCKAKG